jgi:hypothetical protein
VEEGQEEQRERIQKRRWSTFREAGAMAQAFNDLSHPCKI